MGVFNVRRVINNWHNVSLALAVVTALIAVFAAENIVPKLLLASTAVLFLHFLRNSASPAASR